MNKKFFLIALIIFISLILQPLVAEQQSYKDLLLVFPKGNKVSLDNYKSELLLLNFWAPWCIPCRKEFPELQTLQDKYAKSKLLIIGITAEDNPKKIKRFIEKTNISFPILFDKEGKLHEKMKVEVMPTSVLTNGKFEIISVYQGFEKDKSSRQIELDVETYLSNTTK